MSSSDLNDYRPVMQCHYRIQKCRGRASSRCAFFGHRGVMTAETDFGGVIWARFLICWTGNKPDDRTRFFTSFRNVAHDHFLATAHLGRLGLTLHLVTQDSSAVRWGDDTWMTTNRTAGISFNAEEHFLASPFVSAFSRCSFFFRIESPFTPT